MFNVQSLPLPGPTFGAVKGRPGDWHEPVVIEVAEQSASVLRAWCSVRRLPVDLMLRLAVERSALVDLLGQGGLPQGEASALFDSAAAGAGSPATLTGPGRETARYELLLRRGDARFERAACEPGPREVLVPARLLCWTRVLDVNDSLTLAYLDEAWTWELASAASQLLMIEWGLATALRLALRPSR